MRAALPPTSRAHGTDARASAAAHRKWGSGNRADARERSAPHRKWGTGADHTAGDGGPPKNPPDPRTHLDALTSEFSDTDRSEDARAREFPPGLAGTPVRDLRSRESLLRVRGVGAWYRAVGFK